MRAVGLIVAAGMARPTQWKIVGVMLSTGFGLGAYTRGYAYSTATRSEEAIVRRGQTRTDTDRINGGRGRGCGRWIRYRGSGLRFVSGPQLS
jgi:hypothetical protein